MSVTPDHDRPTVTAPADQLVVGDLSIPAPRAAPAPAFPPPVSAPARREASPGASVPDGRRLHLESVAAELEATASDVSWALRLALLGVVGTVLVLLLT